MATKNKNENENAIEPREDMLPEVYDFGQDAGAGYEDTNQEDFAIPMLVLLQGLSPQVKEDGIEGARPGMLINSVTSDLYSGKEGVVFVPSHREHVYIEWVPRDQNGGFVGMHASDSPVVLKAKRESKEFGKYYTPEGNQLKETFMLYGIIVDPETDEPESAAVISFTSTKIKGYKKMMTTMRSLMVPVGDGRRVNPPMFANQLLIKSKSEKNAHGDFYNFDIRFRNGSAKESLLLPVDGKPHPLMVAAKDFAEVVKSGNAKVDHNAEAESGFGKGDGDEDIPF
jgi:hypothetical protein